MREPRFTLVYGADVPTHLKAIDSKYHSLIRDEIEEQLVHQADIQARNRKPLRAAVLGAQWELRLGSKNEFRVFYRVDADKEEVRVLAIGVKERNRVWVAGKEIEL
jgi:mRNA-degrading endonuclease RelE of RelBE toxin-antitoxin system